MSRFSLGGKGVWVVLIDGIAVLQDFGRVFLRRFGTHAVRAEAHTVDLRLSNPPKSSEAEKSKMSAAVSSSTHPEV